MSTQHTDPAETLQIAITIGAQHLLGIHWGTFPLTDEPWDEPPALLQAAAAMHRAPNSLLAQAFLAGEIWQPK